jgi:hypothetical protein
LKFEMKTDPVDLQHLPDQAYLRKGGDAVCCASSVERVAAQWV